MSTGPAVDAGAFKDALASWATGVTVLTAAHQGLVYGITASSFSTLSIDPLLVLVCIQKGNHLERMVPARGAFAVSVLAEGQEATSNHFAISGRDPAAELDGFETFTDRTGCPILAGAIAHLDCELESVLPGGDHVIAVGRVVGAASDAGKAPLLYFRRGYHGLG